MTVNLIAAIGRRGQIGLVDGGLPWREPQDLGWFRQETMGGIIVCGYRTWRTMPRLDGRKLLLWSTRHNDPANPFGLCTPERFLATLTERNPGAQIWIAGGAATYRAFAPYVDGLKLFSAIDYDSDRADDARHVFFPFDAYGISWGGGI